MVNKSIKYFLFLILIFIGQNRVVASEKNKEGEVDFCENYISISGTSNLNKFTFNNNNLDFNYLKISRVLISKSEPHPIEIPVKEFECKNKHMYNDFQKLLKAAEYPNVNVLVYPKENLQIENFKKYTDFNIHISLAGVTQNYILPCEIIPCGGEEYILKGAKEVQLTDFQIDPPVKVFGAVKVDNTVFYYICF